MRFEPRPSKSWSDLQFLRDAEVQLPFSRDGRSYAPGTFVLYDLLVCRSPEQSALFVEDSGVDVAFAYSVQRRNIAQELEAFVPTPYLPVSVFGPGSVTGTSKVAGATWPSFQASNDRVTLALPLAASLGTRTGPRKMVPQQRSLRATRTLIGFRPGASLGNSTSATGLTFEGNPLSWATQAAPPAGFWVPMSNRNSQGA
jgi:hypothetical protein